MDHLQLSVGSFVYKQEFTIGMHILLCFNLIYLGHYYPKDNPQVVIFFVNGKYFNEPCTCIQDVSIVLPDKTNRSLQQLKNLSFQEEIPISKLVTHSELQVTIEWKPAYSMPDKSINYIIGKDNSQTEMTFEKVQEYTN
jgi:hypothetical protein